MNNKNVVRVILASLGIILCVVGLYNEASILANPQHKGMLCSLSSTFDCSKAALSPYAQLLGIPTAAWGASFYVGVMMFRSSPAILFLLTSGALVFSLYLFGISTFVLGAICPICFCQYCVNTLLFVLSYGDRSKLRGLADELRVHLWGQFVTKTLITIALSLAMLSAGFFYIKSARTNVGGASAEYSSVIQEWRSSSVHSFDIVQEGILKDAIKGKSDASVTVVEFLDFECPACRAVSQEFQPIFDKLKDRVRLVFKNYPLDKACNPSITHEMHEHACFAAELARCAGEQGKFWPATELLLQVPLDGTGPLFQAEVLTQVKRQVGLDSEAIAECLRSDRQMEALRKDMMLAEHVALAGTPTFFVNGKKVPGNAPALIEAVILAALSEDSTSTK